MSYKTLLALHAGDDPPSHLAPVAALARAYGAHVDVRVLNLVTPIPTMTYIQDPKVESHESYRYILEETEKVGSEVRRFLEAEKIGHHVTAEAQPPGLIGRSAAKAALYADLVVLSGTSSSLVSGLMGYALEGALFDAGKPVLVLGEGDVQGDDMPIVSPSDVMIAWDGGREAARAVQQSLPILKAASVVRAMIIEEGEDRELETSVEALGPYLLRHGVDILIERVAPAGQFISHALVEQVTKCRPDLLVMGAYGHSRLRERLFAGATRAALNDLSRPLFLAH